MLDSISADDAAATRARLNALASAPAAFSALPESVRNHEQFSKVFYLQRNEKVRFQSKLMENAWAHLQSQQDSKPGQQMR
jgi:hypothetical protein